MKMKGEFAKLKIFVDLDKLYYYINKTSRPMEFRQLRYKRFQYSTLHNN